MTIKLKNEKIIELSKKTKKTSQKAEKKKNWFSKLFSKEHRN